ncbi:MAG TPA: MFS transporter [Bryobacteraceae bacterium]|nr:MFS transporter [Bryobacteraceae bacterium]
MPFLFLLYVVAFLDRVNVGYAGLDMTRELGFTNAQFGFGSGVFFIGYVLLEIPGTILVELWSARKWIARIMVTWGIVAAITGFIHTAPQFYWARFALGIAEAGFFPGVIVYLTHWYRNQDRAKAVAMFMSAIPVSQVIGAPFSALLIRIHWLGLPGWRWLLILEGVPAVICGVVTLFYLTDRPAQAHWLPAAEREWLVAQLEDEKRVKASGPAVSVWRSLSSLTMILLTIAYFGGSVLQYGFGLWLPKILEKLSGLPSWEVTLISAIPYLVSWPAMLLIGRHSDHTGERRWHTATPMFVASIGLVLSLVSGKSVVLGIAAFSVAAIGMNGRLPAFWALPTAFLGGTSAAACIGAINCIGNLGGFVGPYIVGYLSSAAGFSGGVLALAATTLLGGAAILGVRVARKISVPQNRSPLGPRPSPASRDA